MSKKMIISLIILLVIIIGIVIVLFNINITNNNNSKNNNIINNNNNNNNNSIKEDVDIYKENTKINITIGKYKFTATLENNDATNELIKMFPLIINMNDYLSNEKYYDLSKSLTTNSYNPKNITIGDFMLFGTNTLVIFYDSFDTSYNYTRLGRIDDTTNLKVALGNSVVNVSFDVIK